MSGAGIRTLLELLGDRTRQAGVAESADARDSKSRDAWHRVGSTPCSGTNPTPAVEGLLLDDRQSPDSDTARQTVIPNPVARPWRTAVRDLLFVGSTPAQSWRRCSGPRVLGEGVLGGCRPRTQSGVPQPIPARFGTFVPASYRTHPRFVRGVRDLLYPCAGHEPNALCLRPRCAGRLARRGRQVMDSPGFVEWILYVAAVGIIAAPFLRLWWRVHLNK
jgi:hypothetical protein